MDAIAESLAALQTRTLRDFKRAHVLELADGTRFNLDLNLSAGTDRELVESMKKVCGSLAPSQPLPAAPVGLWMRFAGIGDAPERRRTFLVPGFPGIMQRKLMVVVRMERA